MSYYQVELSRNGDAAAEDDTRFVILRTVAKRKAQLAALDAADENDDSVALSVWRYDHNSGSTLLMHLQGLKR